MDDPWQNDPTFKRWARHVLDDMVPVMADSAVICQIVPGGEGDVKFWVELGASIMMDKPIIAVAFDDRQVPDKLRLIADEVVVLPEGITPEGSDELAAAFRRVLGEDV